jgi:hypothetical protein
VRPPWEPEIRGLIDEVQVLNGLNEDKAYMGVKSCRAAIRGLIEEERALTERRLVEAGAWQRTQS